MAARMIGRTRLRSAPDSNAPNPSGVVTEDDAIEIIGERQGGTWLEIRATDESGNVRTGFVPADRVDRDAPTPKVEEDIDLVRCGVVCTNNARTYGVNRDYLIALAWCESRIKNVGTTGSTAFGPFQFIQDTWKGMVARHGQDTGITEAGFRDWGSQVTFAAILAKEATERIRDRLGRLPSATELYFTHILGVEAALHALQGERARKMDSVLLEFYEPKQHEKAAAFVDQIIKNNASVFRVDAQVNSTEQVLQVLAARLREGFDKAQEIVEKLPADAQFQPSVPAPAGAPWMAVAEAERQRGVVETPGAGSNPRIEAYHASTRIDINHRSDDTAWCASFVSFCMANSGNEKVRQANLRSALAADWRNWGQPIGNPISGSVVVFEPLEKGSSGHVALVVEAAGGVVKALGGNQKDEQDRHCVCIQSFSMDKVVSFRWLDIGEA